MSETEERRSSRSFLPSRIGAAQADAGWFRVPIAKIHTWLRVPHLRALTGERGQRRRSRRSDRRGQAEQRKWFSILRVGRASEGCRKVDVLSQQFAERDSSIGGLETQTGQQLLAGLLVGCFSEAATTDTHRL